MNVALFILAIPICIADLKGFVVPNIYNTILLYVALIHLSFYGFGDLRDVLISAVILIGLALIAYRNGRYQDFNSDIDHSHCGCG